MLFFSLMQSLRELNYFWKFSGETIIIDMSELLFGWVQKEEKLQLKHKTGSRIKFELTVFIRVCKLQL